MLIEEIDALSRALDRLTRVYVRDPEWMPDIKKLSKIINRIERAKRRLGHDHLRPAVLDKLR